MADSTCAHGSRRNYPAIYGAACHADAGDGLSDADASPAASSAHSWASRHEAATESRQLRPVHDSSAAQRQSRYRRRHGQAALRAQASMLAAAARAGAGGAPTMTALDLSRLFSRQQ